MYAAGEHKEILSEEYPQWSLAREELMKTVKKRDLKCPVVNQKRKKMTPEASQEFQFFQGAELQQLAATVL